MIGAIGGKNLEFADGESLVDRREIQAAKGYIGITLADGTKQRVSEIKRPSAK